LHTGQNAHNAALVNVSDNSLIAFAALDIEFGDLFVLGDRGLFLATIDAQY